MNIKRAVVFVVQSLSHVQLILIPWTAARQASLSFTIFWSLLKLMSIESMMPSNHLILCHSLLLMPSIFPSIRIFSNESALCIRWPKYWALALCCYYKSCWKRFWTNFRITLIQKYMFRMTLTLKDFNMIRRVIWSKAVPGALTWTSEMSAWSLSKHSKSFNVYWILKPEFTSPFLFEKLFNFKVYFKSNLFSKNLSTYKEVV